MATTTGNLEGGVTPFFTMWVRPRRTMRAILETEPRRFVIPLAMLAGFGNALDNASGRSLGDGNDLCRSGRSARCARCSARWAACSSSTRAGGSCA
jgi:hypothetical protein